MLASSKQSNQPYFDYPFLQGGGEMGALIRSYHWSDSPLGEPGSWPQSLKTAISIILHSKFPMFLFWGPDLICFYNDAYRPSLGQNGKHPSMLGSRAVDSWQEIWSHIKPQIDQVLAGGEASWNEDQLLPIYRNGKLEDVYWTFSYSSVCDESGMPAGVFVTCTETTDKVVTQQQLQENNTQLQRAIEAETTLKRKSKENEDNLKLIILQAPVAMAIFRGTDYKVEIVNTYALELWGKSRDEVMHQPILQAMPELQSQGIKELLDSVYVTGTAFSATELPVQLLRNGKSETAYINFVYEALYDSEGQANGVIAIGSEVTAQVLTRKRIEESEERFRTMAEGTNMLISVADENGHAVYFNNAWCNLTGRTQEDLLAFGWTNLIQPEDKNTYVTNFASSFQEKKHFTGEFRIRDKHKNYRWLLAENSPRFHDGSFAGYISSFIDITQSKEQQYRIKISEQRLEQILNQLPAPVVVLRGANQVIETTNDSLLRFWNKSKEEVRGKPMLEVFPELKDQPFPAQWKHVLETGESITNLGKPVRFMQPDGTDRLYYVDYYYQPLPDINGEITAVLATVIDVTDKVISRRLLEDSQVKLQTGNEQLSATNEELSSTNEQLYQSQNKLMLANDTLFESQNQLEFTLYAAELGTWDLNPVTNRFTGNARLKEWFGLQPDEEIDLQKATDNIDSKDRPRVIAAIMEAMNYRSGGKYDIEYTIINPKSNVPRHVRARGKATFDAGGQPTRLSGTLQDITEEKIANTKLAETNQRLQLALDAGKLGSYDLDIATGKMDCTPQCKANFGVKKDAKFDFADLMEVILPEYRDYVQKQIQQAVVNHDTYIAEYQIQWPDKSLHWISVSGKPTYNSEGKAERIAGVTLDITERKLDDLRKNDFIGMVSHELKTPLTSLSAFIQIVNAKLKTNEEASAAGLLEKANIQVKKMSNLINGFLNVSRFESGKINILKQDFYLNDLLKEMITEAELTISTHIFCFDKCDPVTVNADRDKIGSVISNLLSNAVKYSPQGKTVTIQCVVADGVAQVSVQDEGIGIKPKDQEKLFDRYYRVESNTTQHISGFGIGLYLSAEIIQRHDGAIWVESESGKGSTFFFTLPLPANHS